MALVTLNTGLTVNRTNGTVAGLGSIALDSIVSVKVGGQRVFWPSSARNSSLAGGVLTLPKGNGIGLATALTPVEVVYNDASTWPPEAPDQASAVALYFKLKAVLANRGLI